LHQIITHWPANGREGEREEGEGERKEGVGEREEGKRRGELVKR
jgi:hypothetical protein